MYKRQGKLNSKIDIKGLLNADFAPDLSTISGDALAEILTSKISTDKSPLLSSLESKLDFIDFKELQKNIKTRLSFKDGQVTVKPFKINYKDIPVEISGTHGLSNTMDYNAVFQVPSKYLGSDVNRLIGKINDPQVDKISIPVTANIGGTFSKPNVSTDLTTGIKDLTNQLIEIQKQKLIDKGTDKVNDLIGGVLGENKSIPKDTTNVSSDTIKSSTQDDIKNGLKNKIGDLFKKRKKEPDSTKN